VLVLHRSEEHCNPVLERALFVLSRGDTFGELCRQGVSRLCGCLALALGTLQLLQCCGMFLLGVFQRADDGLPEAEMGL
jgi:hypothetical protein